MSRVKAFPLSFAALLLAAASAHAESLLVPRIAGDWTTITANPDLGDLTKPGQQPVDFAIWQAADGKWQLWSCIRGTREAGRTRLFHRWESAELTAANWQPRGIAMRADPALGETSGGLQAPFVLRDGGKFRMFYGDWSRICAASSADGREFQRDVLAAGQPALFSEPPEENARDPFLIKIGGVWHCYYTAMPASKGAVYCRISRDLERWSERQMVASGGQAGDGPSSAECPHVVEAEPGHYYLFRTQRYGADAITSVHHSTDPLNFGRDGPYGDALHLVTTLPVAAPEIVKHDGVWFIAALRPDLKGIQLARLEWQPLPTPARPAARAPGINIRVALYDDRGSAGKGVPGASEELSRARDIEVTRLDANGIRAGLNGYDVVIFTGGSGSRQANTIGALGREQTRRFVEAGGGYIGICAGAYLACDGFSWGIKVLDAKTPSPKWERGHANLKIEATGPGQALLEMPHECEVIYHNGPVLAPAHNPAIPDFEPLAFFRTEVSKVPGQEGLQVNTPAMARGSFGAGRVLVSSPHPEQTPGMEEWIIRAVRAVAPSTKPPASAH